MSNTTPTKKGKNQKNKPNINESAIAADTYCEKGATHHEKDYVSISHLLLPNNPTEAAFTLTEDGLKAK